MILFSIIALSFILLTSYIGNNEQGKRPDTSRSSTMTGTGGITLPDPSSYELKVAVSVPSGQYDALTELTKRYQTTHPNVKVSLTNLPIEEAYARLKSEVGLGSEYDVVLMDNEWVYEYATAGLISPVNEEIITDLDRRLPDSVQSILQWNSLLWAVPMDMDPYVLVYHRAVLEQLELDSASSFEELWALHATVSASPTMADAEETEAPGAEERDESFEMPSYGLYFDASDPYALAAILAARGVPLAAESRVLSIDSPETLEAAKDIFQRNQALLDKSGAQGELVWDPSGLYPADEGAFDAWEWLREGRLAMRVASLSEYSQERRGQDLQVRLLPSALEGNAASLWSRGRSWVVLSRTKLADQAYGWIEAMTKDESQLSWSEAAGTLPTSESALTTGETRWPSSLVEPWFHLGRVLPATTNAMERLTLYQDTIRAFWLGEMEWEQFKTAIHQVWSQASSPLS